MLVKYSSVYTCSVTVETVIGASVVISVFALTSSPPLVTVEVVVLSWGVVVLVLVDVAVVVVDGCEEADVVDTGSSNSSASLVKFLLLFRSEIELLSVAFDDFVVIGSLVSTFSVVLSTDAVVFDVTIRDLSSTFKVGTLVVIRIACVVDLVVEVGASVDGTTFVDFSVVV